MVTRQPSEVRDGSIGKKRVERIPAEWAEEVGRRVEAGRSFRQAVSESLTANAELLVLERKQRAKRRKRK